MGVVVDENVALDGPAVVGPAHRVAHVEDLQQGESTDEVQGLIAFGEHQGALDATGHRVSAHGEAVGRPERLAIANQPWRVPHRQNRNLVVRQSLPDTGVGTWHHITGFDIPWPRRGSEHVVGAVRDQPGHHPLVPHPALGVGPVVSHHQRLLLGGQRAAHLEIGDHFEVVLGAQDVQGGDPVFGV